MSDVDPRLDRRPRWDDRNWPLGDVLPPRAPATLPARGRSWRAGPVLDQGQEGACVGFAFAGEAGADPVPVYRGEPDAGDRLTTLAHRIYTRAQELDPWPETGPGLESGTSVLAGATAARELGLFGEYRWAHTLEELTVALAAKANAAEGVLFGPAIAGVEWREGMYDAGAGALVDVSGPAVGGHAILIRGVILHSRSWDEPVYRWRNSWGPTYGAAGDALIRGSDLAAILGPRPELCVPIRRARPTA